MVHLSAKVIGYPYTKGLLQKKKVRNKNTKHISTWFTNNALATITSPVQKWASGDLNKRIRRVTT